MGKGLGTLDWSDWLRGIFAAFIGGGAGAVTSGVVVSMNDPKDYNLYTSKFYHLVIAVFAVNGLISMFAFLHQRPVPDQIKTVLTTEKIEVSPEAVITTKVEKTVISTDDKTK